MEDKFVSISMHYDMLIDEGNNPVYDSYILKEYMTNQIGSIL